MNDNNQDKLKDNNSNVKLISGQICQIKKKYFQHLHDNL